MPVKRKKKSSKLTRMSDEERFRYLQHRAQVELEAKRKKQQLIAVFTKNKLKREEAFSRINATKINEEWRKILRKIKYKELYEDVEYLWKNFSQALKDKNEIIKTLCEQLEIANLDHRRLQEANMDIIDELIEISRRRLKSLRKSYIEKLKNIETNEKLEFEKLKDSMQYDIENLKRMILFQKKEREAQIMETRIRNAFGTYNVKYSKEQDLAKIRQRTDSLIGTQSLDLQRIISEYESSTEVKRKQYEYLKEHNDANSVETTHFRKIYSQLMESVGNLNNRIHRLKREREVYVSVLGDQLKKLSKHVWKLRQEMRLMQTIDALQIKRLSVASSGLLKELRGISEKASSLRFLMKICADLNSFLLIKLFTPNDLAGIPKDVSTAGVVDLYYIMENFWQQVNHIKAGNILMRKERAKLISEHENLRGRVKTYLLSISRKVPLI